MRYAGGRVSGEGGRLAGKWGGREVSKWGREGGE